MIGVANYNLSNLSVGVAQRKGFFKAKGKGLSVDQRIFFPGVPSWSCLFQLRAPCSTLSYDLVRSCQHIRRNPSHFGFSILDFRLFGHRITLSALAKTFGGMVNPICLAVFRLMTNSNFVGCSTGKSAGLAPFRILST